ncbi:MAG: hypothetical protein V4750_04920 [Pseudomonadota bacterium]
MNHFTVIAEDETKTLAFYVDLLGLSVGHRPDLGFPGAWLYAGGAQAVLHMYFDRPVPAQRAGVNCSDAQRNPPRDPCAATRS